MRVLVTGATGFVAGHLIPRLIEKGYGVVAVARSGEKIQNAPWFSSIEFIAADIHKCDIDLLFKSGIPDSVIHLAWADLDNYKSTLHIEKSLPCDIRFLRALVNRGVSQMMVTGTCLEYGMVDGKLSENMPATPIVPYAIAKNALRCLLEQLRTDMSFQLKWARLFYTFGDGQNPNSLLAQLDRAIDSETTQFNMSCGEQLRDYMPIQDVVEKLMVVFEAINFEGVINVCSGKPISVRRLVEERLRSRSSDILLNLGYYDYPDYEPMAFWGDNLKFNLLQASSGEDLC